MFTEAAEAANFAFDMRALKSAKVGKPVGVTPRTAFFNLHNQCELDDLAEVAKIISIVLKRRNIFTFQSVNVLSQSIPVNQGHLMALAVFALNSFDLADMSLISILLELKESVPSQAFTTKRFASISPAFVRVIGDALVLIAGLSVQHIAAIRFPLLKGRSQLNLQNLIKMRKLIKDGLALSQKKDGNGKSSTSIFTQYDFSTSDCFAGQHSERLRNFGVAASIIGIVKDFQIDAVDAVIEQLKHFKHSVVFHALAYLTDSYICSISAEYTCLSLSSSIMETEKPEFLECIKNMLSNTCMQFATNFSLRDLRSGSSSVNSSGSGVSISNIATSKTGSAASATQVDTSSVQPGAGSAPTKSKAATRRQKRRERKRQNPGSESAASNKAVVGSKTVIKSHQKKPRKDGKPHAPCYKHMLGTVAEVDSHGCAVAWNTGSAQWVSSAAGDKWQPQVTRSVEVVNKLKAAASASKGKA